MKESPLFVIVPAYMEKSEHIADSLKGARRILDKGIVKGIVIAVGGNDQKDSSHDYSIGEAEKALSTLNMPNGKGTIIPVRKGKGNGMIDVANSLCGLGITNIGLFLDADLHGVTERHLEEMIHYKEQNPDASVRGIISGDLTHPHQILSQLLFGRHLTGQRIIEFEQLTKIQEKLTSIGVTNIGFSIEALLNLYARHYNLPIKEIILWGSSQVDKSTKTGSLYTAYHQTRDRGKEIKSASTIFKKAFI